MPGPRPPVPSFAVSPPGEHWSAQGSPSAAAPGPAVVPRDSPSAAWLPREHPSGEGPPSSAGADHVLRPVWAARAVAEPPESERALDPARSTVALQVAADGYAATHGAPPRDGHRPRRVRWQVSWRLVGVAGAAVLLLAGGVALRAASVTPGDPVVLPVPAPDGASPSALPATEPAGVVVVDVVGAVGAPGIVRLPVGSRVVDAVAAAGGQRADAQVGAINLARVLVDGEQIVVPGPDASGSAPGPAAVPGDDRVDLNTADTAALDALPGIGPVLAERIVAHREDGPFTSVDELGDVSGIGPTLLERLRDLVRV
jgi:competence protein ComEA